MTRDEIGKMRTERPAAFDAAVAEKVMGWKHVGTSRNGQVEWWADADDERYSTGVSSFLTISFKPGEDPAADYSVLKLVRETWTEEQQKQMADELDRIYETRNEFALLAYRPGDHAEAALRVVTADAEGGK